MMGSLKTEIDRYDYEDHHKVTLTQGFWLADTTVTQALWQAVMGKNPAEFTGDSNNPVEQVNWDDSQQFIQQLTSLLSSLLNDLTLRLPSDAEWEYACRAGTKTPFSLSENITPEQVNYNGDNPYADGKKSEYREKTVKVKTFLPNPWGLYEMHGNVDEWCADAWQEQLGELAAVDPFNDASHSSADRVVRGGSWISRGKSVRSAYRYRDSPDYRDYGIGLLYP